MRIARRHPIVVSVVAFVFYALFIVPSLLMGGPVRLAVGTVVCVLVIAAWLFSARTPNDGREEQAHP
jgi:uncharacterized membrane protein YczE